MDSWDPSLQAVSAVMSQRNYHMGAVPLKVLQLAHFQSINDQTLPKAMGISLRWGTFHSCNSASKNEANLGGLFHQLPHGAIAT